MFLRTELLSPKKLIGKWLKMSLVANKTHELWRSFMAEKSVITNSIGSDLYSLQIYDKVLNVNNFDPTNEFIKWAAIEVEDFSIIPDGMSRLELVGGDYAVFLHKGPPSEFRSTLQYIFSLWLPTSGYELDHRPHFEVLGEKYKNNHPESEEEVWIPVKTKK